MGGTVVAGRAMLDRGGGGAVAWWDGAGILSSKG